MVVCKDTVSINKHNPLVVFLPVLKPPDSPIVILYGVLAIGTLSNSPTIVNVGILVSSVSSRIGIIILGIGLTVKDMVTLLLPALIFNPVCLRDGINVA